MQIALQLFGRSIELRTKGLQLQPLSGRGGWWPVIRESFTGAWQNNVEIQAGSVLSYGAVYACVSLIAGDISKCRLRLVEQDNNGIWAETESAAFSPLLRKPNSWSNRIKFVEQWMVSKLSRGATFALKARDQRGVVVSAYVLDPSRVTPLVSTSGDVYYELRRDDLSGLTKDTITVPASDIFHDVMCPLYHPLIGVSPIFACGLAALQGIGIQNSSNKFFTNGSNPGGVLTAPGAISDETALRLKAYWDSAYSGDNQGKIAVLGDGLKFEQMAMTATDAQMIETLRWTAENVCTAFHVPAYLIGIGPPPPYANIEPMIQSYYSTALQVLFESMELCLDGGLGLTDKVDGRRLGTEFDLDDLFRMDTATKSAGATAAIGSGAMSPNEARFKFYDLGPVEGGDTPFLQQQYWPLKQLSVRQIPDIPTSPEPDTAEPENEDEETPLEMAASFGAALRHKEMTAGWTAGLVA